MSYFRSAEFRFGLRLALTIGSIIGSIDLLMAGMHGELNLGTGISILLSTLMFTAALIGLDVLIAPWAMFRRLPKPVLTAQITASLIVGVWLWLMTNSPATGAMARIPSISWLDSLENNLLLGWLICALTLGLLGQWQRRPQR